MATILEQSIAAKIKDNVLAIAYMYICLYSHMPMDANL